MKLHRLPLIVALVFGLSSPTFGADSALDSYLTSYLKLTKGQGFSVVVVKDGKVLLQKGYGVAVAGSTLAMTEHTSTAIGSLTKSMTCLAILQLVDRGLVSLDAPVTRYVPWFRTADRSKSDRITVRMLMAHTSGLPSMDTWGSSESSDESAIEAAVRKMSTIQLASDPGVGFRYTNDGYTVLGLIISTVSGQPYHDYMARNIFGPLGMSHSSADRATLDRLGALNGHYLAVDGFLPAPRLNRTAYVPGGATVSSSASDLGHYLQMILGGGQYAGKRLVSAALFAEWFKPETTIPGLEVALGGDGRDGQYAKGWQLNDDHGSSIISHGGITGTMSSMTMIDPQAGVGVSILFTYGLLDAWRFPSTLTVGHNLLRLARGQTAGDFAIPRVPNKDLAEPFIPLPPGYDKRLIGTYATEVGGKATISASPRGLELELDQFSMREFYLLNFINDGRGVGTSLAQPKRFSVAWNADQSLRFLDIGGNRLYPSRDRLPTGVVLRPVPGTALLVALPQFLEVSENLGSLRAQSEGVTLTATWVPQRGLHPEAFVGPGTTQEVGPTFLETVNGKPYQQKAWRLAPQQRLQVAMTEVAGGTLVLRMTTSEAQASQFTRTVMAVALGHSPLP